MRHASRFDAARRLYRQHANFSFALLLLPAARNTPHWITQQLPSLAQSGVLSFALLLLPPCNTTDARVFTLQCGSFRRSPKATRQPYESRGSKHMCTTNTPNDTARSFPFLPSCIGSISIQQGLVFAQGDHCALQFDVFLAVVYTSSLHSMLPPYGASSCSKSTVS